ncbi:MAG: cytochrome c [Candidatus Tectomicrobia bacterium]
MPSNLYSTGGLFFAIIFMGVCGVAVMGPLHGFAADNPSPPLPSSNPLSGEAEAIAQGARLYRKWCRQCHGTNADGKGVRWAVGARDLRKFWRGFSEFVAIVVAGRPKKQMPPWGGVLQGEEIMQIGAYLETLAIAGANWKDH